MKKTLIWGASFQAKLIANMLFNDHSRKLFFFDDFLDEPYFKCGDTFIRSRKSLLSMRNEFDDYVVAIGNTYGETRYGISKDLQSSFNLEPLDIIHHTSYICESSDFETPILVMPGVLVHSFVTIDRDCILNSGCIVEHEVTIGRGVHIMPGAVLTGRVVVDDFATIGANATVLPGVRVGRSAVIGAGAVVTKDVPNGITVKGVPAV